jgi:hypothetical protein
MILIDVLSAYRLLCRHAGLCYVLNSDGYQECKTFSSLEPGATVVGMSAPAPMLVLGLPPHVSSPRQLRLQHHADLAGA